MTGEDTGTDGVARGQAAQEREGRRSVLLLEGLATGRRPGEKDGILALRSYVPQEWRQASVVRFDGTIVVDGSSVVEGAAVVDGSSVGATGPARRLLGETTQLMAGLRQLDPDACLDGIGSAHVLGGRLELARMHAAAELAARAGEELLRRKGVTDPGELSRTARDRWRASCKRVVAAEIEALTGLGRGAAREVVAIAVAPRAVTGAIGQALRVGLARWDDIVKFWRRCRNLPHEKAAILARALFATDAPADELAVERLDAGGEPHLRPWPVKVFAEALEREATRAEGSDPEAEAAKRAAQHEARTAYGVVDDDGTGQVVITGDAASVAACTDRLHVLAKRARAAGDGRTESQLRSDIARSLLLHGVLPLPELGDEPSLITADQIASLAQVVSGTPSYELQVIVPWDVLTGRPVDLVRGGDGRPVCAEGHQAHGLEAQHACAADRHGHEGAPDDEGRVNPAPDLAMTEPPGSHLCGDPCGATPPDGPAAVGEPCGETPCRCQPVARRSRPRVEGVGRVLGRFTRFLTAGHLRAIALSPGTTLARILYDPADGRCIERRVKGYQPDDKMRAQIHAADVTSRAPGSTTPARFCQLDHVVEYLLRGGPTSEPNLQTADTPWHAQKTEKLWTAVMDATRNVTWTSFFGRMYRTRGHDYRQYVATGAPLHPTSGGTGQDRFDQPPSGQLPIEDQRHLASLLVYAALAQRKPGQRLQVDDDDPFNDDELVDDTHAVIWVRRTRDRDGKKVTGARQGTPSPEEIVATPARDLLDAEHWTDPFTGRDDTDKVSPDQAPSETGKPWQSPDQTPPPF